MSQSCWHRGGREYDAAGNTLANEFQVNTVVEGPQSMPSIGMNASGRAVAVWHGKNEEHESALFAQRFQVPSADPNSLRVGGELQLASLVELEGSAAAAAIDNFGNSIVVFESYDEDGDALGVFGKLIDSFGDPLGESFLINASYTFGNQGAPAVARAAGGDFVVAWQSKDQDSSGYGIYAQRFDAGGTMIGGTFLVNTTTAGDQMAPAVAMGEDGRFVIVWQADGGDGTTDIFAQRFDAYGNAVGSEFQVNQFAARDQVMPAVAMNAAGQFVIAWVSSHQAETIPEDDPEKSIFLQWYDENGLSSGPEVVAHTYVKDAQESPQVGMDAAGNFVVAWQSINQDGSTWGVYARQFDDQRNPLTADEFRVNEQTEGLQRLVGLGVDAEGNFVIAFESTAPGTDDGISTDIYRREFFADGTANGSENLVNTWTGGPQTLPTVARASTGNYGIFWLGQGFSHIDGVHGRLYDVNLVDDPGRPSRIPVGDQFLVGETLGFETSAPAIAVHSDGTFIAAFESFEEDGSGFGIFAQRYNAAGSLIADSRIQINTATLDDQSSPAVASDGAGNVIIVWQSKDASGFGIFGQWLDPSGAKIGGEFRVNATQVGDQTKPDVAIDALGRAVVVWQSQGQDGDGLGVYYVRLDSIGEITGSELMANVTSVGDQQAPSVAAAADNGQFVIAWQGPATVEEGEASVEIYARRFAADGTPGGEFIVNSTAEKDQVLPDVSMDADGDTIFVWQVEGQQGSGSDIFGRRMDSSGNLLLTDFLVNVTTERPQRLPSVGMDTNGNFLVSWQSQHQDGFSWGIYGRAYLANGETLLSEFAINERVEGPQVSPAVASNASGQALVAWLGNSATHLPSVFAHRYSLPNSEPDFSVGGELLLASYVGLEEMAPAAAMNAQRESVVVWTSYAEDGSGLGVFAQLLGQEGTPLGSRFAVNSWTAGNQGAPAVARAADGQFVIAWQSEDQDGEGYGIYAQRYEPAGELVGETFRVNSTTAGDQKAPTVAIDPDGRFIIAWQSVSADGSLDIMAQFYSADGSPYGQEFRVNSQTALDQYAPAIAMNDNGQFVISWVSDHPAAVPDTDDTEKSIFVQAFDIHWQPVGSGEVLVHRYVKDAQESPVVGIDGEGRFVVAWQSINQDGNSWGVLARRFEATMTPIDRREFVVNETRMGPQRFAGLGVDEYGRFVIAWQSNSRAETAGDSSGDSGKPEGSSWDIFARQYSWDGSPEGGELPVNTWQKGPQTLPVVAQAPGGDLGIFWLGQGPDHIEGVHGRLYQSLFEFGDAPDPMYPTLLASDGARHLPFSTLYLGTGMDAEFNGQPTVGATGDDNDANGDDEDGVRMPVVLIPHTDDVIVVNASGNGLLDAWIDWNRDGVFHSSEQIAVSFEVLAGENFVTISVPQNATPGATYARFRISSEGGLSPTGVGRDGEVEDYQVQMAGQNAVILIPDPQNEGLQIPVVTGSDANNTITIAPRSGGKIRVQSGRKVLGDFDANTVSRIMVYGLAGNDTIRVDSRITKPVELHGNGGNDRLFGGSGSDTIFGGEGNDLIFGKAGSDTIFGDGGNDRLYGGEGDDTLRGGIGNDSLYGGNGNDKLYGEQGADRLDGMAGNDLLLGGGEDDTLYGGRGRDLLIGGSGLDRLRGYEHDDILIGGSTSYDEHESALLTVLDEWWSTASFETRVTNVKQSFSEQTVVRDGKPDNVYGGTGRDLMLDFELEDLFRDFRSHPATGDQRN